tara:strand:+ start:20 stop:478 length:459 start_codon:yes stop_codon:yes gene_type:complete
MKLIAHRGNIDGPNNRENHPDYLLNTVGKGYDCEVDVWYINKQIFLGHDKPEYQVNSNFIRNIHFWNHAKNLEALDYMLMIGIHCFWHEQDERTLTSMNYVWTYPNKSVCKNSVVCVEHTNQYVPECFGICSDYVLWYKNNMKMQPTIVGGK